MSGLWFALQFQIRVAIDAAFLCAAVALPEDESDLEVEPCLQSVESRSKSQFVRMRGLEVARQGLAPCKAKCSANITAAVCFDQPCTAAMIEAGAAIIEAGNPAGRGPEGGTT